MYVFIHSSFLKEKSLGKKAYLLPEHSQYLSIDHME